MSKMPSNIFVDWEHLPDFGSTQYVRADIVETEYTGLRKRIKKLEEALVLASNYLYNIIPHTVIGDEFSVMLGVEEIVRIGKSLQAALETSEDGKAG